MRQSFREYCIQCDLPDLLREWHPVKNEALTPEWVAANSHIKVWWLCAFGHEWQAAVRARSNGTGCPVCAHRTLLPGENDLVTTHLALAREWHPTKNDELTPSDVVAGTERKVWWRCEKGHEWQASVCSRAGGGNGCPVCTGKIVLPGVNDLASAFPEIAGEWHPEKNGPLTPEQVSPYSNRKVWWRCELGHEYPAVIASRTKRNHGCPYCVGRKVLAGFNDLASLEPELAEQWHPALNGELTPDMVTTGAHKRVWWQCPDGHVWQAIIYSRARGRKSGCPVCAGKVRKTWEDPSIS